MNKDNNWHPAVLAELKDGTLRIFDHLSLMFQTDIADRCPELILVNWNHGQPLMEAQGRRFAIVDSARTGDSTEVIATMKQI